MEKKKEKNQLHIISFLSKQNSDIKKKKKYRMHINLTDDVVNLRALEFELVENIFLYHVHLIMLEMGPIWIKSDWLMVK